MPRIARLWIILSHPALAWAALLAGAAVATVMAVLSDGTYHDDDLTHYLIARWAWNWPEYLLNDWGRPGFTVLYFLPAGAGWFAARLMSVAVTTVTAWLAYDIARRQRVPLAALVPLLFWLQPMAFLFSYTTLTEPALALYLTLGTWLYLRRHFALSCAVISLCMITRHEGVLFLGVWGLVMLWQRRSPREWLWLAWAPLAHNLLNWIILGRVPSLQRYGEAVPTTEYGAGGWLFMFAQWPLAAGFGIVLLAVVGVFSYARRPGAGPWLIGGGLYLLAHTIVYRFGLFASGGYARFLEPLAPLVAVCAAEGVAQLVAGWRRANRRLSVARSLAAIALCCLLIRIGLPVHHLAEFAPALVGATAVLAGGLAAAALLYGRPARYAAALTLVGIASVVVAQIYAGSRTPVPYNFYTPLRLPPEARSLMAAREAAEPYRGPETRVASANTWVAALFGFSKPPDTRAGPAKLEHLAPGDLFIWDGKYAPTDAHGMPLAEIRARPDFVELASGGGQGATPFWVIFQKRGVTTTSDTNTSNP